MPKFTKKPVIIEAMQFDGTHDCACLIDGWSVGQAQAGFALIDGRTEFSGQMVVRALGGNVVANPGDWIIKGVKGEFYPCKPDIFEATYEPGEGGEPVPWRSFLDERQAKELALAELYARDFHHGTTGHNQLMLIAKMAGLLDLGEGQPDGEATLGISQA